MKTPDAIVVLAGGIKQDTSGRWISTDLSAEDDKLGAPGGKLRVLATAVLATEYPTAVVIASGGKGADISKDVPENRPSLAKILCDELLESGVSRDRIMLEEKSNTTYQQLQGLEDLIQKQGWQSVMIITNRYHLTRLRVMIDMKFPQLVAFTELISAEDILLRADEMRWKTVLTEAYESAFMAERAAKEEKGVLQIRNGTYQFR